MSTVSRYVSNLVLAPIVSLLVLFLMVSVLYNVLSGLAHRPAKPAYYNQLRYGSVSVPLDYNQPGGAKVSVAYVVIPSTNKEAKDVLFVNPGGPGHSGIDYVKNGIGSYITDSSIRAKYTIVAFDPRGVGQSQGISCGSVPNFKRTYDLASHRQSAADVEALVAASRAFGQQCLQRNGALVTHMGTYYVARDLDVLRQHFNQKKLNYLGFSYGTYIGQVYASLFPQHVGRFVFDGVFRPQGSLADHTALQVGHLNKALFVSYRQWLSDKKPDLSSQQLDQAVAAKEKEIVSFLDRLYVSPVPSGLKDSQGNTRFFTYSDAESVLRSLVYDTNVDERHDFWLFFNAAMGEDKKALDGLLKYLDEHAHDGNGDAYFVVQCLDFPPQDVSVSDFEKAKKKVLQASAIFGPTQANALEQHRACPLKNAHPYKPRVFKQLPSILLVGNTDDGATPLEGAQRLHEQLANSRLLVEDTVGHLAYGRDFSCVNRKVDAFLVKGSLPYFNCNYGLAGGVLGFDW